MEISGMVHMIRNASSMHTAPIIKTILRLDSMDCPDSRNRLIQKFPPLVESLPERRHRRLRQKHARIAQRSHRRLVRQLEPLLPEAKPSAQLLYFAFMAEPRIAGAIDCPIMTKKNRALVATPSSLLGTAY